MMSEYVCIKLLTLYVYLSIPPHVFLFLLSFYSKGIFSLFLSVSQLIISIPLCLLLFPYSCVCIFCFFFFGCFFSFLSFFFISTSPMLTQLVSHFISHLFLRAYQTSKEGRNRVILKLNKILGYLNDFQMVVRPSEFIYL